jgi:hypothetical protein
MKLIHIGKNIILKREDILGIFDIESINDTKEFNIILETLGINGRLKDISDGERKSIILYKENDNLCGVISNVSTNSIEKRSSRE